MPVITEKTFLPTSLNNQLPAYISYFVSGMLFITNWDFLYKRLNILIIPAVIIFVVCVIFDFPLVSSLFKPITLCIIIMWFAFKIKIFSKNGGIKDYSYSIYLIHYPLIMCFVDSSFFYNNWGLAFLGALGVTFFISFNLEKCFEVLYGNR